MSMGSREDTFHDLEASMALSPKDWGEGPTGSQKNLGHSDSSSQFREFEHLLGANIMPATSHT